MATKKIVPIKYTSRDFDSIKADIIDHAKRYYPDTYKDFSENSFGSLMVDSVAYIGDILSYYLDYQVNESFLDTALEYDNILKLASQIGYKGKSAESAIGNIAIYYEIPAAANGAPDFNYAPTILRGSTFSTNNNNIYILLDDITFNIDNVKVVVGQESENGPTTYVVKTYGRVISGVQSSETIVFGEFEKFKKVKMFNQDVTEILSVTDVEGNEYFEVDYLSQNVIYRSIPNRSSDKNEAPSILKPYQAYRRFVTVKDGRNTYLQFGGSSDVTLNNQNTSLIDPSSTILNRYAKDYVTDKSFDPNILIESDKFGVAPSNTTLTISFRKNSTQNTNAPAGAITNVDSISTQFQDQENLDASLISSVVESFEVENEESIVGSTQAETAEELKILVKDYYSAQNRAVTQSDYKALALTMPGNFGSVKRLKAVRDTRELRRNINIYVVSENPLGNFVPCGQTIKNNLKTWLNKNRMINDSIDILDAKIVNFGVDFSIQVDPSFEKYEVFSRALETVKNLFSTKLEIGEPIFINSIYSSLNRVDGVIDTKNVILKEKVGSAYSSYTFSFKQNISDDETILYVPDNVVLEIKFPDQDVKGAII